MKYLCKNQIYTNMAQTTKPKMTRGEEKINQMIEVAVHFLELNGKDNISLSMYKNGDAVMKSIAGYDMIKRVFACSKVDPYNFENSELICDIAGMPGDDVKLMEAYMPFNNVTNIKISGAIGHACSHNNINVAKYLYNMLLKYRGKCVLDESCIAMCEKNKFNAALELYAKVCSESNECIEEGVLKYD